MPVNVFNRDNRSHKRSCRLVARAEHSQGFCRSKELLGSNNEVFRLRRDIGKLLDGILRRCHNSLQSQSLSTVAITIEQVTDIFVFSNTIESHTVGHLQKSQWSKVLELHHAKVGILPHRNLNNASRKGRQHPFRRINRNLCRVPLVSHGITIKAVVLVSIVEDSQFIFVSSLFQCIRRHAKVSARQHVAIVPVEFIPLDPGIHLSVDRKLKVYRAVALEIGAVREHGAGTLRAKREERDRHKALSVRNHPRQVARRCLKL